MYRRLELRKGAVVSFFKDTACHRDGALPAIYSDHFRGYSKNSFPLFKFENKVLDDYYEGLADGKQVFYGVRQGRRFVFAASYAALLKLV